MVCCTFLNIGQRNTLLENSPAEAFESGYILLNAKAVAIFMHYASFNQIWAVVIFAFFSCHNSFIICY